MTSRALLQLAAHVGALLPFAQLLWDAALGQLTVNPIQEVTSRTGKTALVLLVLTLACTPASRVLGLRQVIPLRRPLGLYAFFYAGLHLLTFAVLDYGLDLSLIWQAVVEKRFVVAGFGAFLLMAPLAATSTRGWMRRLGRRWKALHRLIYAAALLAVLHFVWLVKADVREPLAYGAVVALLLALRTPPVRQQLVRLRYWLSPPARRVPARPVRPAVPHTGEVRSTRTAARATVARGLAPRRTAPIGGLGRPYEPESSAETAKNAS